MRQSLKICREGCTIPCSSTNSRSYQMNRFHFLINPHVGTLETRSLIGKSASVTNWLILASAPDANGAKCTNNVQWRASGAARTRLGISSLMVNWKLVILSLILAPMPRSETCVLWLATLAHQDLAEKTRTTTGKKKMTTKDSYCKRSTTAHVALYKNITHDILH